MSAITTVPFHQNNLLLIEHNGEPFTAMRPIVEGMGLNWTRQYRKIKDNSKRWGTVALKATVGKDGKNRELICMPVRKLPAFMASIHPSKVKPELRKTIEMYQDECDDALWAYWSEGVAINPRATISPAQQRIIQETVASLSKEDKAYAKRYGALKTHFKIAKYDQLPASKFDEAMEILQGVVIEQKAIPLTPEDVQVPEGMTLVNTHNLKSLQTITSLLYERHQQFDKIKGSMKMLQAAVEVLHDNVDEYLYKTNDAVREANMLAKYIYH